MDEAPDIDGVYAILSEHQRLYIGKGNIQARLISHWNRENPSDGCVWEHHPARYCWEICSNPEAREADLIRDFPTRCNAPSADPSSSRTDSP